MSLTNPLVRMSEKKHVLPSTEFGYPAAGRNQIRLLGDAPKTPEKRRSYEEKKCADQSSSYRGGSGAAE